jgi:hypothetical protein
MKKVNKKARKELPTAIKLILVLIFPAVFLGFGICVGFLINSFINGSSDDIIANILLTLAVGAVYMLLLIVLIRNKDSENVKPRKWYINYILISLTLDLIVTAITVFTLGNVINYLIGVGFFPLIGIISTPNIVKYVKKDTTGWKKIFYDKGNLHRSKATEEYYRVSTPVPFEKKILSAVYKEQLKNILVVVAVMVITIVIGLNYMSRDHSYAGNMIERLIEYRARKAFGKVFFLMIFFAAFAIPIIAYYVSNALKKIRVVKNHEYIAYHAIIPGVKNGRVGFYNKNKHYEYKYCTCVGIREKEVNQTPATLIFIPDDVLLFPDNEEYKVEK